MRVATNFSMKTDTIPKASQLAVALDAVQRARTQSILLGQSSRLNDDALTRAAESDDPIGLYAKAFIESRTALNVALRNNYEAANAAAYELITPFLSHHFKKTVIRSTSTLSDSTKRTAPNPGLPELGAVLFC